MDILDTNAVDVVINILQRNIDKTYPFSGNPDMVIGYRIPIINELDMLITRDYGYLVFGREGQTKKGKPFYQFRGYAQSGLYDKLCREFNK